MISLIHSDFPYSVRIWSSFLNYESLRLHHPFLKLHSEPGFFYHKYAPPFLLSRDNDLDNVPYFAPL